MNADIVVQDGTRIAVRSTGPTARDATATCVFLHGFCMSGHMWARTRRQLAETNPTLRTISYDHRGHGHSDTGPTRSHTVDTFAADLDAVLAATAPAGPIILVGHSLGAMVALQLLAEGPVLINRVTGLGIISSAAGGIAERGLGRLLTAPTSLLIERLSRFPRGFEQAWGAAREIVRPWAGQSPWRDTARRPTPAVMAEILASLRTYDTRTSLPRLAGVAATIVAGTRDHITPAAHARDMAAALPNARLTVIEGADHNLPLADPTLIADEVGRLARISCGMPRLDDLAASRLAPTMTESRRNRQPALTAVAQP